MSHHYANDIWSALDALMVLYRVVGTHIYSIFLGVAVGLQGHHISVLRFFYI